MIARFRLGFTNHTLPSRLPSRDSQAGVQMRSGLQKLVILCEALIDAPTFWFAGYGVSGFTAHTWTRFGRSAEGLRLSN